MCGRVWAARAWLVPLAAAPELSLGRWALTVLLLDSSVQRKRAAARMAGSEGGRARDHSERERRKVAPRLDDQREGGKNGQF